MLAHPGIARCIASLSPPRIQALAADWNEGPYGIVCKPARLKHVKRELEENGESIPSQSVAAAPSLKPRAKAKCTARIELAAKQALQLQKKSDAKQKVLMGLSVGPQAYMICNK